MHKKQQAWYKHGMIIGFFIGSKQIVQVILLNNSCYSSETH